MFPVPSYLLVLGIFLLAITSSAQSPLSLPDCRANRELRKAIDQELDDKVLEKLIFRDRTKRRRAVLEGLITKYPREVVPYNRLIEETWGEESTDTDWIATVRRRFREQAAQRASDPLALYVAGVALFGSDTSESIRLLEEAKSEAPQFPWPLLRLAEFYATGRRMNRQKSRDNLDAFFSICPDSVDGAAQRLLATDDFLQPRVAKALRSRMEKETDPDRLGDYEPLWSLEFRSRPPQEHDALRAQILTDLTRIEPMNPRPDSEWLAFLIRGYQQAGASSPIIAPKEEQLLREYPHSEDAYDIVHDRWRTRNPQPKDEKDAPAWAKYHAAYREAVQKWVQQYPDCVELKKYTLIGALLRDDSLSEKDGVAAIDEYLRYHASYGTPSDYVPLLQSARLLLRHGWHPGRALDLLEKARSISTRQPSSESSNDNLTTEEQADLDERQLGSDLMLLGDLLKAARLAGRTDVGDAVKRFVDGPRPRQEKLQSEYWWDRGRLAALEGRKQDAIAFYQLALQTRLGQPHYSGGRLRDDLTDEAHALWNDAGGTSNGWDVWSRPLASKTSEAADGTWERPKKLWSAFELTDMSGKIWRSKELEGKSILINVWATWCGPCQAELPKLQELYQRNKDRVDIQILTFDIDADLGMVAPFVKEKAYTFPVLPAFSL